MTTKEYLESVLDAQTFADDDQEIKDLRQNRDEVKDCLLEVFGSPKPSIKWAGSMSKRTMIRDSYDGDVTCYFEHGDTQAGETLEEIYAAVRDALRKDYVVQEKRTALRVLSNQPGSKGEPLHVDVVPGRYVDEDKNDVFLHCNGADKERLKTNLDVHIAHVRDSGVRPAIRLVKLWKFQNGLSHAKTFVIELLVIDLLKNKKSKSLEDQLLHVWTEFRDNASDLTVKDPANPEGNDLSDALDACRDDLARVAKRTLQTIEDGDWEDVFGPVEKKSAEATRAAVRSTVARVETPNRPWLKRD